MPPEHGESENQFKVNICSFLFPIEFADVEGTIMGSELLKHCFEIFILPYGFEVVTEYDLTTEGENGSGYLTKY